MFKYLFVLNNIYMNPHSNHPTMPMIEEEDEYINNDSVIESTASPYKQESASLNDFSEHTPLKNPQISKSTLSVFSLEFSQAERELNIKLWEAVERNDVELIRR